MAREETGGEVNLSRRLVGELVKALEITKNTVGDLRNGFRVGGDPARWVEQVQAHIEAALARAREAQGEPKP